MDIFVIRDCQQELNEIGTVVLNKCWISVELSVESVLNKCWISVE